MTQPSVIPPPWEANEPPHPETVSPPTESPEPSPAQDSGLKLSQFQGATLLEKFLEGRPVEYKAKLEALLRETGIQPDDPVFLILIASGRLEILLDEAPQTLGGLLKSWTLELETWSDKLVQSMKLAQRTSVMEQEAAIAQATERLIHKAEKQEARRFFHSLVPALGVLLGAVGLGTILGMTLPPYFQGGIDPSSPRKLTREQANRLEWAMSAEGKYAKQIMDWNRGYLDTKACERDAQDVDVEMKYNNLTATKGYCLVWIKPINQRGLQ